MNKRQKRLAFLQSNNTKNAFFNEDAKMCLFDRDRCIEN